MKIIYILFITTILFNKLYLKKIKRYKKKLERNLVSPTGGGAGEGVSKEIPGTKISITPPP